MALSDFNKPLERGDEVMEQTTESIQRQLARFNEANVPIPETKDPKATIWQRAIAGLRVLEPAPYFMGASRGASLGGVFKRQMSKAWNTGIRGRQWESENAFERTIDTATFSDVLEDWGWSADTTEEKFARGAVGLGLDIVLDPKTWLTFGATKGATKVFLPGKGYAQISKTGTKRLAELTAEVGEKVGKEQLVKEIGEGASQYMAKRGLKFMGQRIVPEETLKAPFKLIDKTLQKLPVAGRAYQVTKAWGHRTVNSAFDYWHALDDLPKAMKDEVVHLEEALMRGNKAEAGRIQSKLQIMQRKAIKDQGVDVVWDLPKYREVGGKVTGSSVVDEVLDWAGKKSNQWHDDIIKAGKAMWGDDYELTKLGQAGIQTKLAPLAMKMKQYKTFKAMEKGMGKEALKAIKATDLKDFFKRAQKMTPIGEELPGYLSHVLTKQGREYLTSNPAHARQVFDSLSHFSRGEKGLMKQRTNLEDIFSINEKLKPLMEKAGIKMKATEGFFEPNFFKALAKQSQAAITAKNILRFDHELLERFSLDINKLSLADKMSLKASGTITAGKQLIKDGITYVPTDLTLFGKQMGKGTLIPVQLKAHLSKVHATIAGTDDTAKQFLGFYDKALGYFKKNVTGWFPAFHTRNAIGGMFNNWLAGLKNPARYIEARGVIKYKRAIERGEDIADGVLMLGGKEFKYSKLVKMMEDQQIFNSSGMMDVMRNLGDRVNVMSKTGKLEHIANRISEVPRAGLEMIENQLRVPLFLDRIAKGESPEIAAKWVYKFHFDYAPELLTPFEKNVMKRIVPFYTWTRHNIPLQFEQLLKQPGKYLSMDKLKREIEAAQDTERVAEERKYMPDWLQNMFTIRMGDVKATGEPYYLQFDLPLEDMNKLNIREILSMTSPLLKYPLERILNKNIYFDSPVYDKSLPREYQLSKTIDILKHLPKPMKDFLNIQEVQWKDYYTGEFKPSVMIDSRKLHFVRSLWLSRWYSTMAKSMDSNASLAEKLTQLVAGEPIRPLNIPREKWRQEKEYDVMLRDMLYHMLRTQSMPYSGEEEDFEQGTPIPEQTFARKLGEHF